MKRTMKPLAIVLSVVLCFTLLLAGCGNKADPGTSPSSEPSASQPSPSAPAPGGDKSEILMGYVAPFTGPLSSFTEGYAWASALCLEAINADGGIYIEEYGKKLPLRVITADTESNPNKASEVTTKLVLDDKVDFLVGAWTPDTSIPVSSVAERYEIPALIENSPAESWLTGGPYNWACGIMFFREPLLRDYISAVEQLDTNKKVGIVFDSEVDGQTSAAMIAPLLEEAGLTLFDPGRFPMSTNDFTNIISQLKAEECEIVIANQITPNFVTFWQQCHQLGYVPKAMLCGKGMEFMSQVSVLGDLGHGIMSEVLWDKNLPYASKLLNMTGTELADKFEAEENSSYPSTIGCDVTIFEIVYDALGRSANLQPETIMKALLETQTDTMYGPIKFNEDNISPIPIVTAQWLKGEKWEFEAHIVGTTYADLSPVEPVIISNHTMGS